MEETPHGDGVQPSGERDYFTLALTIIGSVVTLAVFIVVGAFAYKALWIELPVECSCLTHEECLESCDMAVREVAADLQVQCQAAIEKCAVTCGEQ